MCIDKLFKFLEPKLEINGNTYITASETSSNESSKEVQFFFNIQTKFNESYSYLEVDYNGWLCLCI